MELVEIKEGLGTFFISPPKLEDEVPRRSDSVFFNIHQEINRDFSVLALRAYALKNDKSELKICEPLCGSGIRSCRYALETPSSRIFCNDLNLNAIKIAKKNFNHLSKEISEKINLFNMEGNLFLQKLNSEDLILDFVDIDPYGTPIPFVQNSIQLVTSKGLLAFTATDLASLVGLYPRALYAKYSISHYDMRIGNVHEIATRALITGIQHVGLTLNQSLIPILSFYYRHFVRCFFIRYRGVDRVIDQIGFLNYCDDCQTRFSSLLGRKSITCPNCDSLIRFKIGPLFLGCIQNDEYLSLMLNDKHLFNMGTRKKLSKLLPLMIEETSIDLPWSFEIPNLAQKIGIAVPSVKKLIAKLREKGYSCHRTHFSGTCLKTDAHEDEIVSIMQSVRS
jgi:tRNA (guanine26-N2/guanine27-N2)-dimethyltransferase